MRDFVARRFPSWMRQALNLVETNVPGSLVSERDTNGTPFAEIQSIISLEVGGVAAARTVQFGLAPGAPFAGVTTSVLVLGEASVVAGQLVPWKTLAGTADARVFVPSGFDLVMITGTMIAGETATAVATVLRVPAGFKPF